MIKFDKFVLKNGLRVIVHKDNTTPTVAFNLLYNVGARDENPKKTGFAHLFEHLMFGGSVNIPDFDKPIQMVGGENNAFTNNDITNYYITLPKENIETAFWIESDRMLSLAFSEKSLEVQRNVVVEEFKQRYLNQPYGDVWLLLHPLAYKMHPYNWATIGKDISHIQNAKMKDVKDFFYGHYAPNNAILTVAGNVKTSEVKMLAEKWFGMIEPRKITKRNLPKEPVQEKPQTKKVIRDVPYDAIYKLYHTCGRMHKDYHTTDLISDLLANGKSSRLYNSLVKDKAMFAELDGFVMGTIDPGLFVITGKLMKGVSMKDADNAILNELAKLEKDITERELEKVKNKYEANIVLSEMSVLNKAMNLGYYELLGDAGMINSEIDKYRSVTIKDVIRLTKKIFVKNNCSTLFYHSNK
ncbi:MAG TPA: peptidase M16 [Bacteroidales bacterium]|nr:MAG: peptidase M16 [Bacteroidetes bacterium GWF2_35_48]HBX52115.1 peptidase M16 [Bacteroidales bacterium]